MTARIDVVGLGPAGGELITAHTRDLLSGSAAVWLRTTRHPAAEELRIAGSFDEVYETADTFEKVYATIVGRLLELSERDGPVVYGVPGSPVVAEHTVELLRAQPDLELTIHPALSFIDLAWIALEVDPMSAAATIVDAHDLPTDLVDRPGPWLVAQVHSANVVDDVRDAFASNAPHSVTVLKGLGTDDEVVAKIGWDDLDASIEPDHLTSLWIPEASAGDDGHRVVGRFARKWSQ